MDLLTGSTFAEILRGALPANDTEERGRGPSGPSERESRGAATGPIEAVRIQRRVLLRVLG